VVSIHAQQIITGLVAQMTVSDLYHGNGLLIVSSFNPQSYLRSFIAGVLMTAVVIDVADN
jgi:hypothetical protein